MAQVNAVSNVSLKFAEGIKNFSDRFDAHCEEVTKYNETIQGVRDQAEKISNSNYNGANFAMDFGSEFTSLAKNAGYEATDEMTAEERVNLYNSMSDEDKKTIDSYIAEKKDSLTKTVKDYDDEIQNISDSFKSVIDNEISINNSNKTIINAQIDILRTNLEAIEANRKEVGEKIAKFNPKKDKDGNKYPAFEALEKEAKELKEAAEQVKNQIKFHEVCIKLNTIYSEVLDSIRKNNIRSKNGKNFKADGFMEATALLAEMSEELQKLVNSNLENKYSLEKAQGIADKLMSKISTIKEDYATVKAEIVGDEIHFTYTKGEKVNKEFTIKQSEYSEEKFYEMLGEQFEKVAAYEDYRADKLKEDLFSLDINGDKVQTPFDELGLAVEQKLALEKVETIEEPKTKEEVAEEKKAEEAKEEEKKAEETQKVETAQEKQTPAVNEPAKDEDKGQKVTAARESKLVTEAKRSQAETDLYYKFKNERNEQVAKESATSAVLAVAAIGLGFTPVGAVGLGIAATVAGVTTGLTFARVAIDNYKRDRFYRKLEKLAKECGKDNDKGDPDKVFKITFETDPVAEHVCFMREEADGTKRPLTSTDIAELEANHIIDNFQERIDEIFDNDKRMDKYKAKIRYRYDNLDLAFAEYGGVQHGIFRKTTKKIADKFNEIRYGEEPKKEKTGNLAEDNREEVREEVEQKDDIDEVDVSDLISEIEKKQEEKAEAETAKEEAKAEVEQTKAEPEKSNEDLIAEALQKQEEKVAAEAARDEAKEAFETPVAETVETVAPAVETTPEVQTPEEVQTVEEPTPVVETPVEAPQVEVPQVEAPRVETPVVETVETAAPTVSEPVQTVTEETPTIDVPVEQNIETDLIKNIKAEREIRTYMTTLETGTEEQVTGLTERKANDPELQADVELYAKQVADRLANGVYNVEGMEQQKEFDKKFAEEFGYAELLAQLKSNEL